MQTQNESRKKYPKINRNRICETFQRFTESDRMFVIPTDPFCSFEIVNKRLKYALGLEKDANHQRRTVHT